jgi:hypothetical protein
MDPHDRHGGGRNWSPLVSGINLSPREIEAAFGSETLRELYPPILDVQQVAALLRLSKKTVYYWAQTGRFDGAFRKRGKHLLFWRDRVVKKIFDGPEWSNENEQ